MKPIYQDWSQDTLGFSLSVDPLINALLFYPPLPSTQFRRPRAVLVYGGQRGVRHRAPREDRRTAQEQVLARG